MLVSYELECSIYSVVFLNQVQNFKKQSSTPIPAPILLRVRELAEMQSQVSPDLKAVKFASNNIINDMKSGFL